LWDKTGEPEEDVAQLENLLGSLQYKPRPLEIPATAMPVATRAAAASRTRPATAFFSRPRLTLAASLLMALLAGAWLIARQEETPAERLAKVESPGATVVGNKQPQTAMTPDTEINKNASANNLETAERREDKAGAAAREEKAIIVAASAHKRQRNARRGIARQGQLPPRTGERARAPIEQVAAQGAMRWQVEQPLTPQQREATEQLMVALRLASAKLNYAQREMQEIGRAGR
jgi:hypothetical protein